MTLEQALKEVKREARERGEVFRGPMAAYLPVLKTETEAGVAAGMARRDAELAAIEKALAAARNSDG